LTDSSSVSASKKSSSTASKTSDISTAQDPLQPDLTLPAPLNASPSLSSLRYTNKDRLPYVIQVQLTLESTSPHPLHISRILSQIFPREILEIRKLGFGKVLVQLSSYETANSQQ